MSRGDRAVLMCLHSLTPKELGHMQWFNFVLRSSHVCVGRGFIFPSPIASCHMYSNVLQEFCFHFNPLLLNILKNALGPLNVYLIHNVIYGKAIRFMTSRIFMISTSYVAYTFSHISQS